MNRGIATRILLCIAVFSFCLYSYLDQQNAVTRLRLEIPVVAKQLKDLREENTRLQFEIDLFESPQHLMELMALQEFSHLKHPMAKDVMLVSEGIALQLPASDPISPLAVKPKFTLAMGAKP
ncbi:MAG: hypothetical protein K2P51_02060 [Rhabdochlamydiaceae bacterium]|nr:hypothetical protein [Rhabdochlamydiaceae bacterium]